MDAYYRKTTRPRASLSNSLKRPPPKVDLQQRQQTTHSGDTEMMTSNNHINLNQNNLHLGPQSPAKTPSPQPKPRPRTPTNARLARPSKPPPVKRKVLPDDLRRNSNLTIRELFKSIHQHEESDEDADKKVENNECDSTTTTTTDTININNNNNNNNNTIIDDHQTDVQTSLGIKRLELPATPPATPIKKQVKRPPPKELTPQVEPASPSKIQSGPLRGVSTSLLDLIRAKEAKAKETTPEQIRQAELLGIAPEIVRIVPTVFTAFKRDVLPYDKVIDKCFKGLKSNYTTTTIIECLDLLKKVVPDWVSYVEISRGKFMRLNKDKYTLPQLLMAIQRYKRDKGIVK